MSIINQFGWFIRQQRKKKGMTQHELSAIAFNRPNRSFINQLENGQLDNITLGTVDRILMALNIDIDIVEYQQTYDI